MVVHRKGLEGWVTTGVTIGPESQEETLAFNYYFLRQILPHLGWLEQGNQGGSESLTEGRPALVVITGGLNKELNSPAWAI